MAFCHHHARVAKKETLSVASAKVGTLQALLDIVRKSSTLSSALERELVRLQHAYIRFSEVARDLGFDAIRVERIEGLPNSGLFWVP